MISGVYDDVPARFAHGVFFFVLIYPGLGISYISPTPCPPPPKNAKSPSSRPPADTFSGRQQYITGFQTVGDKRLVYTTHYQHHHHRHHSDTDDFRTRRAAVQHRQNVDYSLIRKLRAFPRRYLKTGGHKSLDSNNNQRIPTRRPPVVTLPSYLYITGFGGITTKKPRIRSGTTTKKPCRVQTPIR